MKSLIILILFLTTKCLFSQIENNNGLNEALLNESIKYLKNENAKNSLKIDNLNKKLEDALTRLDSMEMYTNYKIKNIIENNESLSDKLYKADSSSRLQFSSVGDSISKKSLYAILAISITVISSLFVFIIIMKRQKSDKTELIHQLGKTKSSIEESLIKEFEKQTGLLESEFTLLKETSPIDTGKIDQEPDHSFALKVASEINLIERNIKLMDSGTRGLKQLQASVNKLKDNLNAIGYELPDMLGKKYQNGAKVIVASSVTDDNLEKGTEIITKVIVPQVNYNGEIIQIAQIEVSVNY